jgi:hypothetical protein
MALDHYVSQVHLKNFYSPVTGRLFALRKSDLKRFQPRSRDVCRIEDGSTNAYLNNDRAIEEFLRDIEPKYNVALALLRRRDINKECIHVVAGFAAYVACCAPAAMRIHAEPLKGTLEATARLLDRQGLFGKAPPSLGNKSMTELLAEGIVHFDVDHRYPQALGISSIKERLSDWGNSYWEILHNEEPDTQFLTSDFPVAIELRPDHAVNTIVPLAPVLAVRIVPDVQRARAEQDLSFTHFRHRHRILGRQEAIQINRLIVKCAEDIVFSHDERNWIAGFVAKHRRCRIEAVVDIIPDGPGFMVLPRKKIVERRSAGTQSSQRPQSSTICRAVGRKGAFAAESCSTRSSSAAIPAASPIWSGFWRSGAARTTPKS